MSMFYNIYIKWRKTA